MILNFLFQASGSAFLIGCFLLWHNAFRRIKRGASILEFRQQAAPPLGLLDLAIMFASWCGGQVVLTALLHLGLGIRMDNLAEVSAEKIAVVMALAAIVQLITTAIGMTIIGLRYRNWDLLGLSLSQLRQNLITGVGGFIMIVPIVLLIQWLLIFLVEYQHETLDSVKKNPSFLSLGSAWLVAVIGAPIYEEIFFRGTLQPWLQRVSQKLPTEQLLFGGEAHDHQTIETSEAPTFAPSTTMLDQRSHWMPIVVSALLFGLVHLGQGLAPIPLFVLGLGLGYIYRQTSSIVPCIVIHALLNGFTMFWLTLATIFPNANLPS